jgi:hypothetical protein
VDDSQNKHDCYKAYQEAMSAFIFKNPFYYYWVSTTEYKQVSAVNEDSETLFNTSALEPDFKNASYKLQVDSDVFPRMDLSGRMFSLARNVLNMVYLHGTSDYAEQPLWNVASELAVVTKLLSNGMKMPQHPDRTDEPNFVTPEFAADTFEQMWLDYEAQTGTERPPTVQKPVEVPVGTKPAEFYFKWALDNSPPGVGNSGTAQMSDKTKELAQKLFDKAAQDFKKMTTEEKQMATIMAAESAQEALNHFPSPPGYLAGDISELLKVLKPIIKWQDKIRNFTGQLGRMEIKVTHARENKYKQIPRISLKPSKKVLVAIDTSGSVSKDLLSQFLGEVEAISQFTDVDLMFVDYNVQSVKPFKKATDGTYSVSGRGGTDMRHIFYWIRDNKYRVDGVIVLTDGYTPFPTKNDRMNLKTLWLISEKSVSLPAYAGEAVYFN